MPFGAALRQLAMVCTIVAATPGRGQAQTHTTDVPRVSIGFSAGQHSGTLLWEVPDQTIVDGLNAAGQPEPSSVFDLRRSVDIGLTFSGHVNVYMNQHIGFTGELTYLGTEFTDSCKLAEDGGEADLRAYCAAVGVQGPGTNVDESASIFLMQVGMVIRPFKPAVIQPYFKGLVGVASAPHNTAAMSSVVTATQAGSEELVIYPDVGWSSIRPVATAGAGLILAPINGIQFHVEFRESWLAQLLVAGPTATQNVAPPTMSSLKAFQSILVGLDIVLRGEHSKRY